MSPLARVFTSSAGLLLLACGASHAAILVNESFSSATGNVSGQAATSANLTGNWLAANDSFGRFTSNAGRLDFIRTSTANAAGVPKFARAGFGNTTETTTDSLEFWGYGKISTGTTRGAYFSAALFNQASNGNAAPFVNQLTFGIDSGKAFIATSNGRVSNGDTSVTFNNQTLSAASFDSGEHTYLVQLINLGTTDDLYQLWVDPDMSNGVAGLGAPTVSLTVGNMIFETGSHTFNSNTYTINSTAYSLGEIRASFLLNASSSEQSGWMDDFRVTTSFAEIVAIPEPSSILAGLIGAATLVLRRRRRD